MTPRRIKEEIREKEQDLESFQQILKQRKEHPKNDGSDEKTQKDYENLIETYKKQIKELYDQLTSQGKKSKGNIDKSIFEGKPYLTVSIDKSVVKRNLYDSIRKSWLRVSDYRCEKLVEEKGYVVGVVNKVVMGVVQVDGWERLEIWEGENQGRVVFTGELLKDHPSIEYSLKDRTVSGVLQGFNFDDDVLEEI
jgi:hypothetical protein